MRSVPLDLSTHIKRCYKCGVDGGVDHFGTRKAASGNLVFRSACLKCQKAKHYEDLAAHYAMRPDRLSEAHRRYRSKNATKRRTSRRSYYQRNSEREKARSRAWSRSHPESRRFYEFMRRHRARANALPFTYEQLVQRLSMFDGCWMCGAPASQVDHVKPLSKGGRHVLANLRPSCATCNASKRDAWPYKVTRGEEQSPRPLPA